MQDDDDFYAVAQSFIATNQAIVLEMMDSDDESNGEEEEGALSPEEKRRRRYQHTTGPKKKKRVFNHERASEAIYIDYLGPDPLFIGASFKSMFRISRARFQRILEDVGNDNQRFYKEKGHIIKGVTTCSLEAKLLLPLKVLAFGVAPRRFCDYFQMSETLANTAAREFDAIMGRLYGTEYLRSPNSEDLKGVVKLHKGVHGVSGMFGSIGCSHIYWKNCPTAWQGGLKGKGKKPTIVLEAMCDYNLWIWHGACGFAGTMNDLNILDTSPLLNTWTDGPFECVEKEAGVVPYSIGDEEFNQLFALADGIYPKHSRFVKAISKPVRRNEELFEAWQEGARKDVERAFGVLHHTFKFIARPIHMMELDSIGERVRTCILLHNMCVSDRVMDEDVYAVYEPSNQQLAIESNRTTMDDDVAVALVGADNIPGHQHNLEQLTERWNDLHDEAEHYRLRKAIVETFN